ncbi:ribonuclease III [Mesomycoplasma bovoculi]|uniref:Ribonuclease 3 n=1 Tax=Mesomycoplasma bovoculi M165/69 TaxID=743966 RepID=W5UT26_9BACT|nr:ribonuclease III [Mesomycoplasma bovoculi]AHH45292.1 Ribonuclease III [Mesomycoplasma bovoculi M165/69]
MHYSKEFINWLASIGIKPNSIAIFMQALTHKSFHHENPSQSHYEMLEFLGDAILNFKVSEFIYKKISLRKEGVASIVKAKSVSASTFAMLCDEIGLNKFVRVGKGAKEIVQNQKIKSDIFESFCAAIFLDLGSDFLDKFLTKKLMPIVIDIAKSNAKDPKTEFQEKIQFYSSTSQIEYRKTQLKDGTFLVHLYWENKKYGTGKGKSIKEAEFAAAQQALDLLIEMN